MIAIQDYIDCETGTSACFRRVIVRNELTMVEIDLSKFMETVTYKGTDLLDGFTWSMDVDSAVSTMKVELGSQARAEDGTRIDLSPLKNSTSPLKANAITKIRLESRLEYDGQVQDWQIEWEGYIDKVVHHSNGYNITLECRDTMRPLIDKFIHRPEDDRVYGSTLGTPAEIVMNDILADEGFPPLIVPVVPGFAITTYRQEQKSVQQALQTIADNFAWIVRAIPDPLDNLHWKPTLLDPDRTKVIPDYILTEDNFKSVQHASQDVINIRNSVTISAKNRINQDNNQVIVATSTNPASITEYGEKHMEIFLDEHSFMDTVSEVQDMADAIISDMSTPKADFVADLNFPFPQVALGDLISIINTRFFESNIDLAVVGFSHTPTNTKITLRGGAPVGMTRGWIQYRQLETGRGQSQELQSYRSPPVIGSTSGGGGGGASFVLTTGLADDETAWIKGTWNVASWNASDWYQMRVRITGDPDADYETSPSIQENTYKFIKLATGAEYCASVRAQSRDGVWSPWSLPTKCILTPTDTTPPAAPANVACSTINTGVNLTWDQPPEPDYNVSRVYAEKVLNPPPPAAGDTPPQIPANLAYEGRLPANLTQINGNLLEAETEYNFVVQHTDFSGNVSAVSSVATCTTGRYAGIQSVLAGAINSQLNVALALTDIYQTVLQEQLFGSRIGDRIYIVFELVTSFPGDPPPVFRSVNYDVDILDPILLTIIQSFALRIVNPSALPGDSAVFLREHSMIHELYVTTVDEPIIRLQARTTNASTTAVVTDAVLIAQVTATP